MPTVKKKDTLEMDKVMKDLTFNQMSISEAMYKQPSLYAYYSSLHHEAYIKVETAKVETAKVMSHLYKATRERLIKAGLLKPTEKAIEAEMTATKAYADTKMAEAKTKADLEFLKNLLESFKQKKDMLIQSAMNEREELKRCAIGAEKGMISVATPYIVPEKCSIEDTGRKIKDKLKNLS